MRNGLKQNVLPAASSGASMVQHRFAGNSVELESGLKTLMADYMLASRGFATAHGPLLAKGKLVTLCP
jgi:hypothetical protein